MASLLHALNFPDTPRHSQMLIEGSNLWIR